MTRPYVSIIVIRTMPTATFIHAGVPLRIRDLVHADREGLYRNLVARSLTVPPIQLRVRGTHHERSFGHYYHQRARRAISELLTRFKPLEIRNAAVARN